MKKLLKVLVVILFLAVVASGAVLFTGEMSYNFLVKNIDQIELAGGKALLDGGGTVNTKVSTSADSFRLFNDMVKAGVKQESLSENISHSSCIDVTAGGNLIRYNLFYAEDTLLISKGDSYLNINTGDWNRFSDTFGEDLYRIPSASVNGIVLPILESDYKYRKMDGKLHPLNNVNDSTLSIVELSVGESLDIDQSIKPVGTIVTLEGLGALWEGSVADFASYVPPTVGQYTVNINSNYNSTCYSGNIIYTFIGEYKELPRKITFNIIGNNTYPGEIVILKVTGVNDITDIGVSTDINFSPKFFKDSEGEYTALMAVGYSTKVGNYSVKMWVGDESEEFPITINNKSFQIQNIIVDENTTSSTIDNTEANEEYNKAVVPLRQMADSTPHWRSADFIWPVGKDARVTTEFGMIRYVNDKPTSVRHGAIDFAVPKGTDVNATNNGTVIYAGFLQLTGNTVVIEHGYGLKSWYYHMDSLSVKPHEAVVAGQKIGEVGSTGFSTGPHLHFGISVNGIKVNPTTIIDDKILE